MGIKVQINTQGGASVAVKGQNRTSVRTVGIAPDSIINSIAGLGDVNMSGAQTGDTLIYDANTQTFTISDIPVVNGGTF